jgi:hypothetical protein
MNRRQARELFGLIGRFGTLSTADGSGTVDSAIFGSGRWLDDDTLVLGLGDNRTLANLRENPKGVFLFFEPGETLLAWKGARLYLELVAMETSGARFDDIVAGVRVAAGRTAARGIRAAVTFRIREIRPIIDLGGHPPS